MTDEFLPKNESLFSMKAASSPRNGETLTLIRRLKDRIRRLEERISQAAALQQQREETRIARSKLYASTVHDLRQPLQTLNLLYDALATKVHDESVLKLIDRIGRAVANAAHTLERLSDITQMEMEGTRLAGEATKVEDRIGVRRASDFSILIVEDDPSVTEALEQALAGEGYDISVATDGWLAFELLTPGAKWPDLIIADYALPKGLNGFDVVDGLQEVLDHDFGAVILTETPMGVPPGAFEEHGCVRFGKPVDAAELRRLVRRLLTAPPASCLPSAATATASAGEGAATVFVVDDDPEILSAMRSLLETTGYTVETYDSGAAFFASCAPGRTGCVLVDALMPGMDGFEVISRLKARNYGLPAIMITGMGDVPMAVRAMKAGAADFIEKPVTSRELFGCLRKALKRPPGRAAAAPRQEAAEARFATLTKRQRQIMDLILSGASNKTIAAKLELSQRTVESHRAAIMRKTGAKSFAALIRWAIAAA